MSDFVNPAVQAANIIRRIGDKVSETGKPIHRIHPVSDAQVQLFKDLQNDGLIKGLIIRRMRRSKGNTIADIDLTLNGWRKYESEKRDRFSGNYGFVAMQFNDDALDHLVREVIKPAVKSIGYNLVDMRDVAQAGVIDNIMRAQIGGAAFIIADLSHDNLGAYWEAGYAEGLGKPVIYICERSKFEDKDRQPHFDTNHCTTIPWSTDDPDKFSQELIATLRRSLDDGARAGL